MIEPLAKYHTTQTAGLHDWESHWQAAMMHLEVHYGVTTPDANSLMHGVRVFAFFLSEVDLT